MSYRISLVHLFLVGIFILLFSWSCKTEDPCITQHPVTARFDVYENLQGWWPEDWRKYATDTVLPVGLNLVALETKAESYQWIVGKEVYSRVEHNGTDLIIGFDSVPPNFSFPVTLIVKKKPNKDCFPHDDGIDTFTKRIQVAYKMQNGESGTALKGTFRGALTDKPNEIFDIKLIPDVKNPLPGFPNDQGIMIENLYNGCTRYPTNSDVYGYNHMFISGDVFEAPKSCPSLNKTSLQLQDNGRTLVVNYNIIVDSKTSIKKQFVGKKID